ncbi:hypothetical protein BGZ83_007576 [Gryganskiella cystojenkinii]|nr:hypothetical protein BGZ83_007576 [Gryganskiella cystojenkinii]
MKVFYTLMGTHNQPKRLITVPVPSTQNQIVCDKITKDLALDHGSTLRLFYAGKMLSLNQTLFESGFSDGHVIHVLIRQEEKNRGAPPPSPPTSKESPSSSSSSFFSSPDSSLSSAQHSTWNSNHLPTPDTDRSKSPLDPETEARLKADAAYAQKLDEEERQGQEGAHATTKPSTETQGVECRRCEDDYEKKCKECGCFICGGKDDDHFFTFCDQCNKGYHTFCYDLGRVSGDSVQVNDQWFCRDCRHENDIVNPGEEIVSKKRSKMPSASQTRKWGCGLSCKGVDKPFSLVDQYHVGRIPGIAVGSSWRKRLHVAAAGMHRPPVAGIGGTAEDCGGAVSIVLSGGYAEDTDEGESFIYTGSGGRNLKDGNKRTDKQTSDQALKSANRALARTCDCPVNPEDGGVAKNWRNSRPVRVIRGYEMRRHYPEYAPREGFRYDGIYKLEKYWEEKGKADLMVWRFKFRRDDTEPAPWTAAGKRRIQELGLKIQGANEEDEEDTPAVTRYTIPPELSRLMEQDAINAGLWSQVRERNNATLSELLQGIVESDLSCAVDGHKLVNPVTTDCGHNFCQSCLRRTHVLKGEKLKCPICRRDVDRFPERNQNLSTILETLLSSKDDIRKMLWSGQRRIPGSVMPDPDAVPVKPKTKPRTRTKSETKANTKGEHEHETVDDNNVVATKSSRIKSKTVNKTKSSIAKPAAIESKRLSKLTSMSTTSPAKILSVEKMICVDLSGITYIPKSSSFTTTATDMLPVHSPLMGIKRASSSVDEDDVDTKSVWADIALTRNKKAKTKEDEVDDGEHKETDEGILDGSDDDEFLESSSSRRRSYRRAAVAPTRRSRRV